MYRCVDSLMRLRRVRVERQVREAVVAVTPESFLNPARHRQRQQDREKCETSPIRSP